MSRAAKVSAVESTGHLPPPDDDEDDLEEPEEGQEVDPTAVPPVAAVPAAAKPRSVDQQREEKKFAQEEEREEHLRRLLHSIGWDGSTTKLQVFRDKPREWQGKVIAGLLETFHHEIDIDRDIKEIHGGGRYRMALRGPNPENPRKQKVWTHWLDVPGDPKTASGMDGPVSIADVAAKVIREKEDTSMQAMIEMFKEQQKASALEISKLTALVLDNKNAKPTIDPAVQAQLTEAAEERKRAHELMIKKMDAEAVTRAAQIKADAEMAVKKMESDNLRLKAEMENKSAEQTRAHEKELERIKADSLARVEETKARAEEAKAAAEATRKGQEAMADAIKESAKQNAQALEKMVDKMGKSSNALDDILKLEQVRSALSPERDTQTANPLLTALADNVKPMLDKVETVLQLSAARDREREKRPRPTALRPNSVAAVPLDMPALPAHVPETTEPPPPDLPTPDFQFPTEAEFGDIRAVVLMLAKNVELALGARWDYKKIYTGVVKRFPAAILQMARSYTAENLTVELESNAPPESLLRTPRGKQAIRGIHGLLTAGIAK